jgi:molybdopterin synthase catalytic subunit
MKYSIIGENYMKVKVTRVLDDLNSLIDELKRESKRIGSITVFVGVVRQFSNGDKVLKLEYEANEDLAQIVLEQILKEAQKKHKIIDGIIEHRLGDVEAGEDVFYAIVASEHREEGLKALKEIVDNVKNKVPIWKKEVTETESRWVDSKQNKNNG